MRNLLLVICILMTGSLHAQDEMPVDNFNDSNPILFAEFSFGSSFGRAGGLTGTASFNGQWGKSLFTFRFTGASRLQAGIVSPFFPFPYIKPRSNLEEHALLYGFRFIQKETSFSISLGLSRNNFTTYANHSGTSNILEKSSYWGLPWEFSFKGFQRHKQRYRIYYLIPVGKPTAFGRSFGFRFGGNISPNSYAGMTFSFGWGWHKKYE